MPLGARAFLKKLGFDFDRKSKALDKALFNSLDDAGREELQEAWEAIYMFGEGTDSLYSVPSTGKQAALLFSHEREKTTLALKFVNNIITALKPSSLIEYGCGAGYQLQYINHCFPEIELTGLDIFDNLLNTIPSADNVDTLSIDYYNFEPKRLYDLAVCDTGWDQTDVQISDTPDQTAEFKGQEIILNLVDDFYAFYKGLLACIKKSISSDGSILFIGRIPNATTKVAFFRALETLELSAREDMSQLITIKKDEEVDKIHAYVIQDANAVETPLLLEKVLQW